MADPTSQTGFSLDVTELLRSGVQLSKFPTGKPFWCDVDGLQFTESSVKRKPGRDELADFGAEPIRGITAVKEFDTKVAYVGDLSNLYSYRLDDGSTDTVGTGYTLVESSGATTWDSGSTTWDTASTVWDEGANAADLWSFASFGTFVLAANDVDPLQIKKNNINFNDLTDSEVSGASVNAAGATYAVGDTVTFTGGAGTGLAATVTEITGTAVKAFEITNFGSGYADADGLTQNTTSGSGTGLTVTLQVPDATFTRVRTVATLGPHVLAFNYDKGTNELPFDFAWCSEDDPDTWIAASANSAGSLTIREATSEIKTAVPLGNGLGVYTEDQLFMVSYTGAPFYFGYRRMMSSGVGSVSTKAVVSVDRKHYGLSRRGLFVTDGVNTQSIGLNEGINSYLEENIAITEYPQVVGYHNKRDNEVIWFIPIGSSKPTEEIYYNYEFNTFGVRTGSLSAAQESGVFDSPLTGDADGKFYVEGEGGSAQSTIGTTTAHDLGDSDRVKEVTSIRVGKRGVGSPVIRVGWADVISDTPTYTDSFTVDEDYKEVFLRTVGRYIFLEVTSSGTGDTWELTHMTIKGRMSGER